LAAFIEEMRYTQSALILFLLLFTTNVLAASILNIPWESSFESAKAKAALEHKPILLLHVFGRLDQEFT
jgi:hypothetical protein